MEIMIDMTSKKCSFFVNNSTDKFIERSLVRFLLAKQVLWSMMGQRTATLYSDTSTSATTPTQRSELNKKLRNNRLVSLGLTAFSLFCLSLTVALTFFYRTSVSFPPKQLAVSLFMVICCLGAAAAVLPPKCSGIFHHRETGDYRLLEGTGTNHDQWTVMFKGHHPTCGSFTNHVLQIRGKTYCAGCLGLLTGALIAIAVGLIYSLHIVRFGSETTFVFWFGFATVLVGLIQYAKPLMMKGSVHFFLNVVFVIGAFFLLVGVIEINGSLVVEMYLLVMTLYWIFTRIILSEREHERTCTICEASSCAYHPH